MLNETKKTCVFCLKKTEDNGGLRCLLLQRKLKTNTGCIDVLAGFELAETEHYYYYLFILFIHYTIRSLYCHRIFSGEFLCLGLSTLVHQGLYFLDPSADPHPYNPRVS